MRKTITTTLVSLSLVSTASFANVSFSEDDVDTLGSINEIDDSSAYSENLGLDMDIHGKGFGACAKLNLDDAQKDALKKSVFEYKSAMIDLKASMKKAMLNYVGFALNLDGKAKEKNLAEITQQVLTAKSQVTEKKMAFKNEVLFDILKEDQRGTGLKCMLQIKKAIMMKKCKMFAK